MITTVYQDLLNRNEIYKYNEVDKVFAVVRKYFRFAYTNRKHKYFDVPASFDIETTSFIDSNGNKASTMYVWQLGIYGLVIVGRTWHEFTSLLSDIVRILDLNINKRLIIYVHNLSYEMQFMRKWFEWEEVFSVKSRTPLFALTTSGIEFRCSYLLSGYSLEMVGKKLQRYHVEKLVGYLDYNIKRHSKTVLSDKELQYCVNDVKVVMAYIAERMEEDGSIAKIPLTKTGYVRNYCRNNCFYDPDKPRKKSRKRQRYREIMQGLTLDPDEYKQLKRAFQGGFTHANSLYTGTIMQNVTSWDFTSSYPTVMIANKFPMSAAEEVEITTEKEFYKNLNLYCCIFDIEFFEIENAFPPEDYILQSRCWDVKKGVINNGRIHSADHLCTTMTEADFFICKKVYKWKEFRIANMRRYRKGYLPTDFVKSILKLYSDKTTLKGVAGREVEYLNGKEQLNSTYGMAVTDIVRDEITYIDDEWGTTPAKIDEQIEKYNTSGGRFLFYPWGVYVTAYARANLWSGILECGDDYIYSDTDSIKIINEDKHTDYINEYNKSIRADLIRAMDFHGIDHAAIEPETVKGIKKCLGVWDFDGSYSRFKTLGAKRYMVEYSTDKRNDVSDMGKITLTVAGLNKKVAIPYMKKKFGDQIFESFTNQLYIPSEHTGKLTHTYIDDEIEGVLMDFNGVEATYHEKSCVHLSPADYSLSLSREYINFLFDIQGGLLT